MTAQRSLAEVQAEISAAFHGGEPNWKIRDLQAEQEEILGNAQLAQSLRAEAQELRGE